MALFGACSLWGTFLWGDGTQYCNRTFFIDKYSALVEGALDEPVHRLSVTVKHTNGTLYNVFSIQPLISTTPYDLHHNSAHVDQVFLDKIAVTVNHSNGTIFRLDRVRPHLKTERRRI